MKKLLILSLAFLACVAFSGQASALVLTIDDQYYLGYIDDGINASEANEELWVTDLKDLKAGDEGTSLGFPTNKGPEDLLRSSGKVFDDWDLPDAEFFDKDEEDPIVFYTLGNGFDYVLGKYGTGQEEQISHVWYTGHLDWTDFDQIAISPDRRLSHISVFNGYSVPEPANMLLLGTALLGLAGISRRKFKR